MRRVHDDGAWDGVVTVGAVEGVRYGFVLKVESAPYSLKDQRKK